MNILFGPIPNEVTEKYTVLELDTFYFRDLDQTRTAYCIVDQIPLSDLFVLENLKTVHADLIQAYRNQNWEYCVSAVNGLVGRWNGDLDSFYEDLGRRVIELQKDPPDTTWSPVIERVDQTID